MLDAEDIQFLDSSGLQALILAGNRLADAGGRLLIEGMSGAVQRVLEITGLIDHTIADRIVLSKGPGDVVTLGLSDVTFIDSSGASTLLTISDYSDGMEKPTRAGRPLSPTDAPLATVGLATPQRLLAINESRVL